MDEVSPQETRQTFIFISYAAASIQALFLALVWAEKLIDSNLIDSPSISETNRQAIKTQSKTLIFSREFMRQIRKH